MEPFDLSQTIVAPATIPGTGAITVIRMSGKDTFAIADKVVTLACGEKIASSPAGRVRFASVAGPDGKPLDEVMVSIFKAPHSYTGEDSVEISCHASRYIADSLMRLLCSAGARMAQPGEFTRRAFVNGKMDLAQAEAVADVIAAGSEASHRVAMNQLKGGYSAELGVLREKLLHLTALLELELDFSEEEVEFADRKELVRLTDEALEKMDRLAASFRDGNAIRNGVPVAIVGGVNTGKSTLLNALLGEERAIVSDIAGTTRDTVEETMVVDGVLYRFIDTAGIRETSDKIEKIGISRALDKAAGADIIIALVDGTTPLKKAVKGFHELAEALGNATSDGRTVIICRTKVDLYDAIAPEEYSPVDRSYGCLKMNYPAFGTYDLAPDVLARELGVPEIIDISARTGEGLDLLRERLSASQRERFSGEETLVTNLRHYEALRSASESLRRARTGMSTGLAGDLLAQDLRESLHYLGSITGEIDTEEVLGEIFRGFCIGK